MKRTITKGMVLLAEPFMLDPNFKRTAIFLIEHDREEGSLGFILNRPIDMRVDEVIDEFPEFDAPVFFGGPVGGDTIHYLHTKGDLLEGSDEVGRGIWWGGDYERLKFLIRQELIRPKDIRFFVGYSGWSENQLQEEMQAGSWVPAPMFPNYLFQSEPEKLWSQVMSNKGNHFQAIAEMEESARYN